ncbi:PQQ-binding-like beta-propeller repeat protein [bacterium]|nr:PQQ-binding-like beta-propeller repeat protein [bacterium]
MLKRVIVVASFLAMALSPFAGAAEGDLAREILTATGVKGGFVLHIGCGDGKLTAALRASDGFLVHGLDTDAANVAKARTHVQSLGLTGAVTVSQFDGSRLPVIDNLVTLLVAEDLGNVAQGEILRALRPHGVAYVKRGGAWTQTVKPRPKDIDEWTHYLHDAGGNAVAQDAKIAPPRHMQWLADPMWSRNHHKLASTSSAVAAKGRLFTIVDDGPSAAMSVPGRWRLIARDAFNGVLLWQRPLAEWAYVQRGFRSGPVQLQRTLVTDGDRVYVPLSISAPASILDAATGKTLHTCNGEYGTEELVVHDGVLLIVGGTPMSEQAGIDPAHRGAARFPNKKVIMAVRAETGEALWQWDEPEDARLMPVTLAAAGKRVYFEAGQSVVCLDLGTGKEVWRSAEKPAPKKEAPPKGKGKKKGKNKSARSLGWAVATLVVEDGVALLADAGKLRAFEAESGKPLWDCPARAGFKSATDLFVVRGLVWLGSGFTEGRDLRTGEIKKKTNALAKLRTAGHHHRCYREKATSRYIMSGHRGIEFLDVVGEEHSRNNWIRGVCQYGILPCNGLIYTPPHACGCYMEAKLYGFWAVSAARSTPPATGARLTKGAAYGKLPTTKSNTSAHDWPMYRRDPLRTGSTEAELSSKLGQAWSVDVGGAITAPVVAEGIAVVAVIDEHRVVAVDAATGKPRWAFTAGGRVDSPPTIHKGLVLFGCADGNAYCLRAGDGALVWRFRAAPADLRTVVRNQVESVWPLHGSVLVENGVAYVAAGRNTWIDGGISVIGLDPATGKKLSEGQVASRHPKGLEGMADDPKRQQLTQNATDSKTFEAPDRSDAFSMSGTRSDVLVSDGTSIYLRNIRLDRTCAPQPTMGRHLFSTSRLIDGEENHRSHWAVGTADFSRTPVAYSWIANRGRGGAYGSRLAVPYGVMLAYAPTAVWGVRRAGRDGGYNLFAEPNEPFSPGEEPKPDFHRPDKSQPTDWQWSTGLSFRPRAMVRAGKTLAVAGMPDIASAEAPYDVLAGKKGGMLFFVSVADGKTVGGYALDAPPVWDGMAVAGGNLYVSTTGGKLVCLSAKGATALEPYVHKPAPAQPKPAPRGKPGKTGKPGKAVTPEKDGSLILKPEAARTTGGLRYQADRNNLGGWTNPKATCEWNLQKVKAGAYRVTFAYGTARAGVGYTLVAGDQKLPGKTENTGGMKDYKSYEIGTVTLPKGNVTLVVKPDDFTGGALMNFRLLTLTPAK